MFKKIILALASLSLMSCASTPKKSGDQAVKKFFKNSEITTIRISPDGKQIAALRPYKDRMNLFVKAKDEKKWQRLTSYEDRSIHFLGWKSNKYLLFMKDIGGDENHHIYTVELATKEIKDLTPTAGAKSLFVDKLKGVSKDHILVANNRRLKKVFDIYKINLKTAEQEMVLKNPGSQAGWLVDHKGQIRIAIESDGVNNTYYYRKDGRSKFQKIKTLNFKQDLQPLFFDKDNKNIYALSNLESNTKQLVLMNPKSFKKIKTIYSNSNYDMYGAHYSKKLKKMVSGYYVDWKVRDVAFDPYYLEIYKDLSAKLPGKEVELTSHNKSEDFFIVHAGSDKSRGLYYTYDVANKELEQLADPSPWLNEDQMATMKPIKYKSRDGLTIEGYLTLPKGKEAKNLPLVVNPHGGPWARDVWGFNSEAQYLADQGFAVLQMNFRGSTGYGRKFWEASFKQWGKKMQDDITDGVKWAIEKGYANKDNVCIYGGSYGGYATLAGLAFTPDLYKCGVDYVGVSNLFTFQETIPPYWEPYKKMFHEMVGHPEKDKELLKSASPYFHADKIKATLFVAQGANDPRVKKAESDQMVEALKKRGIEVEYLIKHDEGHGFHNEENRFEFYSKMGSFLRENLN